MGGRKAKRTTRKIAKKVDKTSKNWYICIRQLVCVPGD